MSSNVRETEKKKKPTLITPENFANLGSKSNLQVTPVNKANALSQSQGNLEFCLTLNWRYEGGKSN